VDSGCIVLGADVVIPRGFSVFQTPIIPFPWDTVIAALVALGLYIYGTYSGILTEDLFVALRDMSIEVNKP
jgi:hypothetical protein